MQDYVDLKDFVVSGEQEKGSRNERQLGQNLAWMQWGKATETGS